MFQTTNQKYRYCRYIFSHNNYRYDSQMGQQGSTFHRGTPGNVHAACKVLCPSAMALTVMAVISACSCWKAKFSTLNLKAAAEVMDHLPQVSSKEKKVWNIIESCWFPWGNALQVVGFQHQTVGLPQSTHSIHPKVWLLRVKLVVGKHVQWSTVPLVQCVRYCSTGSTVQLLMAASTLLFLSLVSSCLSVSICIHRGCS